MRQGLHRRLRNLEECSGILYSAEHSRDHFRIVVTGVGWTENENQSWYIGPLDLQRSTCSRELTANGTLCELVQIHGNWNQLSNEELDQWIATHPSKASRNDERKPPELLSGD